jgi:uncharacterized protein (TIGR02757 family)
MDLLMTVKDSLPQHESTHIAALKICLDRLLDNYGTDYLDTDPLGIVHRYKNPADIEIAGFIASALAFGGAPQIRKSVEKALMPAGDSPTDFAANLSQENAEKFFRGFYHRWTKEAEIAGLFLALGNIVREYGSIGSFVKTLYNPEDETISFTMAGLSGKILGSVSEMPAIKESKVKNGGISYLVPSPVSGSACKRLAMYFRWMVRGPDGLDFGLWKFIPSSKLVIPLDRHIARMGQILGLTGRKSTDWKMAVEITDTLRLLDPEDPVKYDFALVRPGITGKCRDANHGECSGCELKDVCTEAE